MIAASVVDADGDPVFTIESAGRIPPALMEELASRIVKVNGLG
jgi:hypothetical protein